ncbi:hypothetical protein BC1002_0448 [Paraburkholderia atlantica]|uniref:HTH domain-containing protein n=2 Tax=Paraburkholderia atlantica TaxID=2654982 RepID=D5WBZ4_PARAM|nr:hypothetical protein BC1002_0448 [Paraburkholderia atlantica]
MIGVPAAIKALVTQAASWLKPKVIARAKALRAEHTAYRSGKPADSIGMYESFNRTYERLLATDSTSQHDSPSFLTRVESLAVVAIHLRSPSVQRWLALSETKASIFTLAEFRIYSQAPDGASIRAGLADAYARETGEAANLADGAINSVIDALVQSYNSGLEDQSALVIGAVTGQLRVESKAVRGDLSSVKVQLQEIAQTVEALPTTTAEPLATREVERQLDAILKTRTFDEQAVTRIRALAEAVLGGNLREASSEQKQAVFLWATRLLAADRASTDDVRKYFSLVEGDETSSRYLVTKAMVLECTGHADEALRLIRDVSTDEARSAVLNILRRRDGWEVVIAWYEQASTSISAKFLTPTGWTNLAGAFAEAGRWEDAIEKFQIARPLYESFPDLYFIEGMYRAVMVVPPDFRLRVLNHNLVYGVVPLLEGDVAEEHRRNAIDLLSQAETRMVSYSALRAGQAREVKLWLSLRSRDDATRDFATKETQEALSDQARAVNIYHIARQFSAFQIDGPKLWTYLSSRLGLGGLSDDEWINFYFLAVDTLLPTQLLKFLDEHDAKLSSLVDARILTTARIAALMQDGGQAMRARTLLNVNRSAFSQGEAELIEAQISAAEGTDIRLQLVALYEQSPSLSNASALVSYLAGVKDFAALLPVAQEVYRLDRTAAHALNVVSALQHLSGRAPEIVAFLAPEGDIVRESEALRSALAWARLEVGDWRGAKSLNDSLLAEYPHIENHVGLDFNIAVKSGDWDHFHVIFEREWPVREKYDSSTLLLLAQLAGDSQASRIKAFELLKLAVDRGNGSARVLVSAYNAAVNLGMEDELTASWLALAASTDNEGIIQHITLRQIVEEVIPSNQRRSQSVVDSFGKSAAPIQLLASVLNLPLGRLFCAIPAANENQHDPRKRFVLPLFGSRIDYPPLTASGDIGLDVTAVLTLARLDLLDKTLSVFSHVYIAADTMPLLLKESRRIRFHQPSQIRLAETILEALDSAVLVSNSIPGTAPDWLIEEVGEELATALARAQAENGLIVASYPILKAGTLAEERADLGEYADRAITVRTFVHGLLAAGKIPKVLAEQADAKLAQFDRGEKLEAPSSFLGKFIYADTVAIRHLQQSGVLDALRPVRFQLYAPADLKDELEQTVAEAKERERTVAILDGARIALRRAMETDRVRLLPDRRPSEQLSELTSKGMGESFTAIGFLQSDSEISRLVVDDRYFTRLNHVVSDDNRPIASYSSLDVIDALSACDAMSVTDGLYQRNRLRSMGAAYVAVMLDEVLGSLLACSLENDVSIVETHELKTIRQSIALSCTVDASNVLDRQYLDSTHRVLTTALSALWTSDNCSIERAIAGSSWVLDNLARPIWTAAATVDGKPNHDVGIKIVALTTGTLLFQAVAWEAEKRRTFHTFVEERLLRPARRANMDFIDSIVSHITHHLLALLDLKTHPAGGERVVAMTISELPIWMHERLITHEKLGPLAKLSLAETIQFGSAEPISVSSLFEAAQSAARNGSFESAGAGGFRITRNTDSMSLQFRTDNGWENADVIELNGLLLSDSARVQRIAEVLRAYGPTFPEASSIKAVVTRRPLSESEFLSLMMERAGGVMASWARIARRGSTPPHVSTLAPSDLKYYVRLMGPLETQRTVSTYLSEVAGPYRTHLVQRDLTMGLRITMFGYVDSRLSPSILVSSVDNDTLWNALNSMGQIADPYSLAALVDITLSRSGDERFLKLAGTTLSLLCVDGDSQEQLYEPISVFARLALSEMQTAEGAAAVQPYWKRIAAWIQGGVVVEHHKTSRINVQSLRSWAHEQMNATSDITEIQDMYLEPSVTGAWMTGEACRCNVLRLVHEVVNAVTVTGVVVPEAERLQSLIDELHQTRRVTFLTSGPCTTLDDREDAELSESDRLFVAKRFEENAFSKAWAALASTNHLVRVSADCYRVGADALREARLQTDDPEWIEKALMLHQVANLATTSEDHNLADIVRDILVDAAAQSNTPERVVAVLNGIFLSAGSRRDYELRESWLQNATNLVAHAVPAGIPAGVAAAHLGLFSEAGKWRNGPASWPEIYTQAAS